MNDMLCRQTITLGDLCAPGLTAAQNTTFLVQLVTCGIVNSAIDAASTEERRVRGVDDGVNAQCRDVSSDDFQPRRADLARAQDQTAASTAMPLSVKSCCNSPAWNISRMMSQPPTNSPLT